MAQTAPAYTQLEDRFRRYIALRDAEGLLHWDMATMMPEGGAAARGEQLATLSAVRHTLLADTETADLLDAAEADAAALDGWQSANLIEMRRLWQSATALDEDLVVALSRAATTCETAWRSAREDADFKAVLPHLETLLARVRDAAEAKAQALDLTPYDALLSEHEPGVDSALVDDLFEPLGAFLKDFLPRALDAQAARPPIELPKGPFPIKTQRQAAEIFMEKLGFDFQHGRLDVSLHPFCGGTPDDVRITTRYDEDDFTSGLMGVLHETGHALYDRALPEAWRGQPVGDARGMAVHESQSLLIEMQVCRSRDFLTFAQPILKETFAGQGPAWEIDNLVRLYQKVEPSHIRVDADEVTYPAHVILRYRLEKAMIEGAMDARDLPGAWNDGIEDLLGIRPANDAEGCLQDIHWYDGAWGYFPTYTLGALMAAQLFAAARTADPAIGAGIAKGDFTPLMGWLGTHVHSQGARKTMQDILIAATGQPLDIKAFCDHLEARYLD